jgi:arginyl-tRNA---protein transferase
MWAHSMSPDDYQDLIDRGWRRSGCYCYKPNMKTTCCPSYTIKTDASDFKLNKSHKKIIKKMNKYLKDGIKDKTNDASNSDGGMETDDVGLAEFPNAPDVPRSLINLKEIQSMDSNLLKLNSEKEANDNPSGEAERSFQSGEPAPKAVITTKGPDPNKPTCKKAKTLRLERRREKLAAQGLPDQPAANKNVEKTLEDFLNEAPTENCAHKLKVDLKLTACTFTLVLKKKL